VSGELGVHLAFVYVRQSGTVDNYIGFYLGDRLMYRNLVGNIEQNWSAEGGRVLLVCCEDVVPSPPRDLNKFHPKESASTSDQNFRCLNRPVSKESRTRPLLMLGASTMKNC